MTIQLSHTSKTRPTRYAIKVKGIVQGVGFRPFIYNLARKYNLKGWILNSSEGVMIEVEGKPDRISEFIKEIKQKPPALAVIEQIAIKNNLSPKGYTGFEIKPSLEQPGKFVPVSPDISICSDCLIELLDPSDRRYLYPFINCTNCGPRFTITKNIPYDRKNTTMSVFRMCDKCQAEYDDPTNRRFHAQPNACAKCGPHLELWDHSGKIDVADPIEETIKLLKSGKIGAIKGLGGFHLACDAQNDKAITELRSRKLRTFKPFAIMSYDLSKVEQYCYISEPERQMLLGPRRPIVLLRRKPNGLISNQVAPNNNYIGVMLPYTPLHYILLKDSFLALVMTSANISEEPICMGNNEAKERLKDLADYFLIHNRDINIRCDDSVATVINESEVLIRRSRGYAPHPLYLNIKSPGILACGAELKNTFCLSKDNSYFISQHIGDLQNVEAYKFYCDSIAYFKRFFRIQPKLIAYDLHPDYLSTQYALNYKRAGFKLIAIQHHYAHLASCMVDNNLNERVIGVIMDGVGYGTDGKIWGGEFLTGDYKGFNREGHLKYIPQPGGDAATKNPYRMALSYLYSAFGKECLDLDIDFIKQLDKKEAEIILQQIDKNINTPLTSSCGRLFDAVSALIGVRDKISYEAQAAIELEMIAADEVDQTYQWQVNHENGPIIIDTKQIFSEIIKDLKNSVSSAIIAAKFHNTVADFISGVCRQIKDKQGLNKVVLSGGVFQNRRLLTRTLDILRKQDFEVFSHKKVPTNDGGISLGQAVIAASKK